MCFAFAALAKSTTTAETKETEKLNTSMGMSSEFASWTRRSSWKRCESIGCYAHRPSSEAVCGAVAVCSYRSIGRTSMPCSTHGIQNIGALWRSMRQRNYQHRCQAHWGRTQRGLLQSLRLCTGVQLLSHWDKSRGPFSYSPRARSEEHTSELQSL